MKSSRSKRGPRCKPLVYKTQEQNLADQLQACLHSLEETQRLVLKKHQRANELRRKAGLPEVPAVRLVVDNEAQEDIAA